MADNDIKQGDSVAAPKGPFWPRKDREKISQAITAWLNVEVKRGAKDAVHISGRNVVIELNQSAAPTPTQPTTASIIDKFRVDAELYDRLTCVALTGADKGKTVTVFKPVELVNRSYDVTYWGWQVHYQPLELVVAGVNTRSANKRFSRWVNPTNINLNVAYKEVIFPKYIAEANPDGTLSGEDNVILATKDEEGKYYDLNLKKPRKWMKEVVVCTTIGTKLALIDSTQVYEVPISFAVV